MDELSKIRMGGSFKAPEADAGLVFANVTWAGFCRAPGARSCELPFHWVVAACICGCQRAAFGFSVVRSDLQWGVQLGHGGRWHFPFSKGNAPTIAA